MAEAKIHAVQTLVRVVFTDGRIASLMMPLAEVDPASSTSEGEQAVQLMEGQAVAIRDHVGEIGPVALHEAATEEHTQRRDDVQRRADTAEARNTQRRATDAEHSNGSRPAE